jgi:DNA-binding response OmpR family regulator
VSCNTGSDALAAYREEPFDLVITDLGMPGMSGFDLAGAIRQTGIDVPIIMITGWGDQIDKELLEQNRIETVMPKPFDIEDMVAKAGAILLERQAQKSQHKSG